MNVLKQGGKHMHFTHMYMYTFTSEYTDTYVLNENPKLKDMAK